MEMRKLAKKTIDEKIKELDRRYQTERDKELAKACSENLRRQILVGKFLMEKQPSAFEKIINDTEFNSFVTLDIDRKLFGFEITLKKKSPKNIDSKKTKTQEIKNDTPEKQNEVLESSAQESLAPVQISSLSPELPWEEVNGQIRLYLTSKIEERDTIVNAANSIFGKNSRTKFYDFDKEKGQWFIVKPDSQLDLSPLRKWIFPLDV